MADSGSMARLREIAQELRDAAAKPHGDDYSVHAERAGEMATAIDELLAELDEPNAGTHAYELIAATEAANIENTETLIHLVAATVLMQKGKCQEPVVTQHIVTFSPADMDYMHQHYIMHAVRDGLNTTITLDRRDESLPPMALQPGIDDSPAKPQAPEHVYDRPLWAVRVGVYLLPALDRIDAETRQAMAGELATVENRYCYHPDCPSTACVRAPSGDGDAEVTSAD